MPCVSMITVILGICNLIATYRLKNNRQVVRRAGWMGGEGRGGGGARAGALCTRHRATCRGHAVFALFPLRHTTKLPPGAHIASARTAKTATSLPRPLSSSALLVISRRLPAPCWLTFHRKRRSQQNRRQNVGPSDGPSDGPARAFGKRAAHSSGVLR